VLIADRSSTLQILHVSDRRLILISHNVILSLLLSVDETSHERASITTELNLTKYVGDKVHVHQATVVHADNRVSTDQCTLAIWTSADELCILAFVKICSTVLSSDAVKVYC